MAGGKSVMSIPMAVESKLTDDLWKRGSESKIDSALESLGVDPSSDFAEFYRRFWGPFHSARVGHELLDVIEQDESVLSATQSVRDEFGFPNRFIAISTLTGNSLLVYDVDTGQVFDVDFEGGDELLLQGELDPRWRSWNEFVTDYFGE